MTKLEHTIELASDAGFVFGRGKHLESLNNVAVEVSATDIPVLISGESGSGKDAYAGLIHRSSNRRDAQLLKINCSMVDRNDLMRQLQEGLSGRTSQIGTLYLDNLDELELGGQRLVLDVLSDTEAKISNKAVCPRLISSSTRSLEAHLDSGKFRRELYYRLNCIGLELPPVRDRKDDIVDFLEHFLKKHAPTLGRTVPTVDESTISALMAYDWPGNLHELENLARKILILGNAGLAFQDLKIRRPVPTAEVRGPSGLKEAAKAASQKAERELILEALQRTRWNRKKAARDLQISYKSLLYKIKDIGVPASKLRD